MLALAFGIGRHEAFIFQIKLNFLARLPELQQSGLAATIVLDAACLAQNPPDGRLRARQTHASLFEHRIALEVVEDGFWSWDALQVLWRLHTHLQDALYDSRLRGDGEWRCEPCS